MAVIKENKMRGFVGVFLGFLVLTPHAFGRNSVSLKLSASFLYRDLFTACSTAFSPGQFYLSAEVTGESVTRASLSTGFGGRTNRIFFSQQEAQSVELYADPRRRLWLAELKLTPRLLFWVFQYAGHTLDQCRPSVSLATVSPTPFSFLFGTEGLGEGTLSSTSQIGSFQGNRIDGYAYNSSLQFVQQQDTFRSAGLK